MMISHLNYSNAFGMNSVRLRQKHYTPYEKYACKLAEDEKIIKELLSRWVSELEPEIVYQNNKIIGLAVADDPTATVHIHVPTWRLMA